MFDEKYSEPVFLCLTCQHVDVCRINTAYKSLFSTVQNLIKLEQPNTFNVQVQCQFYKKEGPTQRSDMNNFLKLGYMTDSVPLTVNEDAKRHRKFHG